MENGLTIACEEVLEQEVLNVALEIFEKVKEVAVDVESLRKRALASVVVPPDSFESEIKTVTGLLSLGNAEITNARLSREELSGALQYLSSIGLFRPRRKCCLGVSVAEKPITALFC